MANPSTTNVDGSNPGPNVVNLPDTVQMPVGNIWKIGSFLLTLSPVAVAANTAAQQTFAATGIGLLPTDIIIVNSTAPQAGLGVVGAQVTATDTLGITFVNATGSSITPTASSVYRIGVLRVQPNWTAPATGNQLDW